MNSLGKTAFRERKLEAAGELFEQALRLRRGLDHRIGIADSLNNLGDVLEASGESTSAMDHYRDALTAAVDIEAVPLVMEIFIGVGDLLYRQDEGPLSAELLSLARHHAGTWWEAKRRAASLLSKVESQSSRNDFQRAVAAGRAMPYAEAVDHVLAR